MSQEEVLACLQQHGELSPHEISKKTGIGRQSVSRALRYLIRHKPPEVGFRSYANNRRRYFVLDSGQH